MQFNHHYFESSSIMARGQQKIQSQQRKAQKMEKLKKSVSHDQKKAAAAALNYKCKVCMVSVIAE